MTHKREVFTEAKAHTTKFFTDSIAMKIMKVITLKLALIKTLFRINICAAKV